jgi:hypothetical protein
LTDQQQPPGGGGDPFDPYANLEDLTGGEGLPPLEDPSVPAAVPPRSPILTGLIVALLLVVVSISIFQLLREDEADPGDVVAPAVTTTTQAPSTTVPVIPTADPTPTTTAAPLTTVTVSVPGTFEPYEAVGDPIPLDELRMGVDGIGPIEFGVSGGEAVGRLISSLGPPEADSGPIVSTGAFGVCEGQLERIVRWGPFVAIVVVDDDGTETFGAYRIDFSYGDVGHEATNLQTVSGLRAAQSVVALEEIYSSFQITYEVIPDLGTTFQLRSTRTGNLLLWGPVTSDDSSGIVLGIYSPDACDRI